MRTPHLTDLFAPEQDFSAYAWQPFRPGLEICRLYGEGEQGPSAALLRYQPGAHVPLHVHTGYEHIFVLRGSQRDRHALYEAGSFVVNPPGTRHDVISEEGCVVLAIWQAPVAFVGELDEVDR